MAEWFSNLVAVVAVLGVVGLVFATGQWVGRVISHINVVSALLKEIRQDVNEIRQDIKEILGCLPPAAVEGDSPPKSDRDQNAPHRTAEGVRAKLAERGLTEADISDAVAWARSGE